ncbi:hypothetical protein B0H15DRAFT_740062, partial [Mycena belliarum]
MSEPVENLRIAYHILERNVNRSLRTQRGDSAQLSLQVNEALQFLQAAEPHRAAFPATEYATLQQSITAMVSLLDEARHLSSDPPEGPNLVVSQRVATGGRPRLEIDRHFLSEALDLRGPSHLAAVFGCSARTIRRRALLYGLAQPGQPVYTDTRQTDGTITRSYSSTARPVSTLTDDQLDTLLTSILEVFPDFGRRMLTGRLKSAGHHVPRARITASYLRIVIHAFVDGKSRLVTGIRVSNNNTAITVLDIFRAAVAEHGLPSRVPRGAAGFIHLGPVRIVHNTRIERMWYDVTHGFGHKWKKFFTDLEVQHGLNPQ